MLGKDSISEQKIFQWSDKHMYKTSYNDMSITVLPHLETTYEQEFSYTQVCWIHPTHQSPKPIRKEND